MGFLPPLIVTGVIVMLLMRQPDLGTSVIIFCVAMFLLFIAGTRTSYILLVLMLAVPVGWKLFIASTPWRLARVAAFLNPFEHRHSYSYQLWESMLSVGAGGFFGRGLGEGRQKLFYVPEAHNDFILATIGEELGFVGVVFVVCAFGVLIWRGLSAAIHARDDFGRYLAFGLTSIVGLQAFVNMGVVLGLLPTKGLPLPFVSYGGTALLVNLFMAGVLANISAQNAPEADPSLLGAFSRRRKNSNKYAERRTRVVVEITRRKKRGLPPNRSRSVT